MYRLLIITWRVSLLKKKKEKKNWKFSLFFHANKNELMDMEAVFFVLFCFL